MNIASNLKLRPFVADVFNFASPGFMFIQDMTGVLYFIHYKKLGAVQLMPNRSNYIFNVSCL